MTEGKISQSKLFKVAMCEKCGRVQEHEEVKDYSECTYESTEKLSHEQLIKAINEGNVIPEKWGSCEDCCNDQDIDEFAYTEEDN